VIGPTATGKSDLAVELALALDGEVVNADSMQLYQGMDIGTAKLTVPEQRGVTHHLLDVWPVTKSAAVAQYQAMARSVIDNILGRGRVAVVVGGSGLYVRGVLDRLDFPGESPQLRQRLADELELVGSRELHARLAVADPAAAAAILPTNARRVMRALEVIEFTGRPFTATMPAFEAIYPVTFVGLDRADLDSRVEQRVARMMRAGLVAEVSGLLAKGLRGSPTAGKALGYAQLLACLDDAGTVVGDLSAAQEATARATRRFARRQRSWFGRDPRIEWLDGAAPDVTERALALARAAHR
jgi:tRNA dimethylallyltransferase